ncbi:oligopeptidase B [Zhouia amylolytica]|uniref:Proline-specific endopeptidase n=1 Tax=Zhouia amylolytica TaxID=376730 RepID=A0A1I6UHD7_9FLAO|nr:S9 family peptidase [Zhouia amylolytica]MCQ0112808.1 S9 family peptidase [Zhouia amylolytica]SFT00823.1 oligopeptidase B [Zhouia amylolytica]
MENKIFVLVLCAIFATSCKLEKQKDNMIHIQAPKAKIEPTSLEKHGDIRIDNYFWMNQRDSKDVLAYLEEENAYYDEMTRHTKEFQTSLFEEMKGRIKEDDSSVPYKYNGYWYITRYETGKDYPVYTRKKGSLKAKEEVLFDCNQMAEGHSYFHLKGINISPDNKFVAYGIDTVSRRQYDIKIKNIETGEVLPVVIKNTTGGSVWANDNITLFYTRKDQQTLRSDKIYKHTLGTDVSKDKLVYEEKDETFNAFVYKTKSRKYIVFGSSSTLTAEYSILPADNPDAALKIFQGRERGMEYGLSHFNDSFYILTNADGAINFKLMKTPEHATEKENWIEVIGHREDVLLEDIDIFKDFLVVSERSEGLNKIKVIRWDGQDEYYLPFDNETYTAYSTTNIEFDTQILRYGYTSLTTPASIIDFDMVTKEKEVKKEQEILDPKFDKRNYVSERVWATAEDGTKVPISLVYRKGIKKDGSNPLLQYGYGSYGATIDPYFSSSRLTLLDRGFIYAIAHIRGGEYLGRPWYDDGKLLRKKNTFTDYVAVSKFLIDQNYTSPEHLYAMGGSAGGLLMGAVMNIAPELYNGVIASVPFVDVVTTMLDESIPLTTGEYDEWGNPNDKEYYEYIKSYSPYDNIENKSYPNLLVLTGYHDSQVQYWEPAKWVAKLRELKSDDNKLLFHTNMDAGHSGASGRFEALKELAEEYAFLLDLEHIQD